MVSAWIPSTFAGESNGGGNSRPSTMEDVIKEHERMKKEGEFARRTGMSTAKAERIRELSAANTQQNRDELVKWFKSLPQTEPACDVRQAEKTVVVKTLAGMMPPTEFKAFGLGVLNTEINALREAKKWEQESYYPKDVIFATFEALVRVAPEQDIVDTLSAYAQDRNVASDVRARFKAYLTDRQFQQDGLRDLEEQARIVIGKLITPPRHPIPWNINNDKEKRIAYAKSEEYAKAMQPVALWRFSETSIENDANEQVLDKLGMAAVSQLIRAVEKDGYTGEKRDYLIFLATDTLFKHLSRCGTLSDSERGCLKPLRRLFDTMPDSGAFCWRHRAAGNVNKIYEKLGIDEKVRYVTDPSVDEPSAWKNVK